MPAGPRTSLRPAVLLALAFLALVGPWVKPLTAQPQSRIALTGALADLGTIRLDDHRQVLGIDRVERDGHLYSDKAPGQPFAAVPFYLASQAVGAEPADHPRLEENLTVWWVTFWSAMVPGALLVFLMVMALQRDWPPMAAVIGATAMAVGTLLLPFSAELYGHVAATALVFGAWTLVREPSLSRRAALGAGALAGAAVLVEYQLVLAVAVLAAVLVWRDRASLGWFVLAGAPFAAALLGYQAAAFGGPFSTSYAEKDVHTTTVAGVPKIGQAIEVLIGSRGLFLATPIVLFALVGLWSAWRSERLPVRVDAAVGAAMFVAYFLLQSGWSNPWGGEMPGPRYLITALPFLAVGVVALWGVAQRVGVIVLVWSAVVMAFPLVTLHLVPDGGTTVVSHIENLRNEGVSPTIWTMALGPLGWVVHAVSVALLVAALVRSLSPGPVESTGPAADVPNVSTGDLA